MRILPVLALSLGLLTACGDSCRDLANRLCQCSGGGSARDACERGAEDRLSDEGGGDEALCDAWLDSCHAPDGATFCEWINTTDAKVACGIALDQDAG